MSIWPRKEAPSAMPTRGATRSPSTVAVLPMLIVSVPVMLPLTLPITLTTLACTCAPTRAFWANREHAVVQPGFSPRLGPQWSGPSLALNSPLMTIDCPTVPPFRSIVWSLRWSQSPSIGCRFGSV